MAFKNYCFVSYRHGQSADAKKDLFNSFARQVKEGIEHELLDLPVFFDVERIKGGYVLDVTLGQEVCQSVCLVVVFTREYLSERKPYCAAELLHMIECQEKRFQILGANLNTAVKRHIITIAFRNPDLVPKVLKDQIFYDFSTYDASQKDLRFQSKFAPKFVEMADFIRDWYEDMKAHEAQICADCHNQKLLDLDNAAELQRVLDFIQQHRIVKPSMLIPS